MSVSTTVPDRGIRYLLAYLLLSVAYVFSGKLGLMLALPPGYVSPIFPPAGIAVAAVLIAGRMTLPWIFAGSLILNIWVGYSASGQIDAMGLELAIIIAIASMLQAAIGGWGLRRAIGYPVSLDHSTAVLRFLLLAPVICLASASFSVSGLWAMGIIDTASFAINWASWWVGDTLGLVVLLPLVMIVTGEPRALWKSRRRTVAVPMLLVFALFVAIFLKANQWEYTDSLMEFRQISQQAVNQVRNELEEQDSVLEQTAALFIHDSRGRVTREEFHRFVERSLVRFPMIQALEWAAPVEAANRASFEAAQDIAGFEIRERNAAGKLTRAGERNIFYPVTYVEPLAGNQAAFGFDMASNPARLSALNKAKQSGSVVISPAVHLVQDSRPQAGVLLILAVNPHDSKSGVVLSVLRIGDFMDKLLQDTRPMLYTRLVDLDEQKIIYDNFLPGTPDALYAQTFEFGARHYRLETAPTSAYLKQHHGWQSWGVLATGILVTGLLGALLLLGTGHTARIEAQVDERTRELTENKKRLQEAQHLAQIGSWELDLEKNILIWSDEIYDIFEIDPASFGASYQAFLNAIHPEDRSLVDSAYAESVKNRVPYSVEHRLLFPDGRIKFVHERGETFHDLAGRAIRSAGTVQDITPRKLAEEMLREKNQLLDSIVDNIPNMIFLKRASDLRFEFFNRAGEVLLGHGQDELLGRNDYDLFPIQQADFFTGKDRAVLAQNDIVDIPEERIETPHGTRILHTKKLTLRDEQGQPQHLLGISEDITERKLAEEAVRISQEKFATIFNQAPLGIALIDSFAGKIYEVNPRFAQIAGRTIEEMTTIDWMTITHPDDVQKDLDNMALLNAGKIPGFSMDKRYIRPDGSLVWINMTIAPLRGEQNVSPRHLCMIDDITERKQAENSLRKLSLAVEQSPNSIVITDLDANIEYVNESFIAVTGYSLGEVIGQNPRLLQSGKTPKSTYDEMWTHLTRGEMWNGEFINRRKDGSEYTEMARMCPVRQADGSISNYLSVKEDITERKLVEAELRIAAIAFEAQEGMMIADANHVILRVNHAFTEITGYTAEEAVGQTPEMLNSDRHNAAFYAAICQSVQQNGSWQGEIWSRRKSGEVYPEQLTITAVSGEAGEITHYVTNMYDITLRHAAELQIHNLAFYDALTQLPNRRLLTDRLGQAMAASRRSNHYGALMFMDLDNFKPLNDLHGHVVGDLLLVEVARRINACVRETDTVARFGGDEFVVVLSELDTDKAESAAQAGIVAEKIRVALAEPYVLTIPTGVDAKTTVEHHCTSSIGVVLFISHEACQKDIIKWADMAMYQAKEAGRNQFHFYDSKI
jgi:diguanylate cyclase (GGDEF)-like protein/PAS domain S-box-containing protein